MQMYRKRGSQIIIEAMKLSDDSVDKIANWAQAQIVEEKDALTGEASEGLNVKTPYGKKRASRGMYVVKFSGEFYVAAESSFESMYELLP